jgi:hypothetical protein
MATSKQIILLLDVEHVQEVYEILCDLPFEKATMYDTEPPTKRQAGIEQLIDQIESRLRDWEESEP